MRLLLPGSAAVLAALAVAYCFTRTEPDAQVVRVDPRLPLAAGGQQEGSQEPTPLAAPAEVVAPVEESPRKDARAALAPDLDAENRELRAELDRIRSELTRAKEELRALRILQAPSWSPLKAVGPPDANLTRDDQNAWASRASDMGPQWLELDYDPPLRASGVRIYEGNVPGAVVAVHALDPEGRSHILWGGYDPTEIPGPFDLVFETTSFPVATLRIELDTDLEQGWNEIDAVELIGPDGRAWAVDARASSYFGEQR